MAGAAVEEFLDEPAEIVDWAIAFKGMENELESEAIKNASKQRGR